MKKKILSNYSNLVYTNHPFSNNEFDEWNELLRVVIRLIRLIRSFYKIIVFIYLLGVLLSVIIIAVAGTYMYRHRFDKYEQSQEEQAAGIKAIGKDSRFLVAYFSWPSPDYPDLDATSGAIWSYSDIL